MPPVGLLCADNEDNVPVVGSFLMLTLAIATDAAAVGVGNCAADDEGGDSESNSRLIIWLTSFIVAAAGASVLVDAVDGAAVSQSNSVLIFGVVAALVVGSLPPPPPPSSSSIGEFADDCAPPFGVVAAVDANGSAHKPAGCCSSITVVVVGGGVDCALSMPIADAAAANCC